MANPPRSQPNPALAEMMFDDERPLGIAGEMLPTPPPKPQQPARPAWPPPPDWEQERQEALARERKQKRIEEAAERERQLQAELQAAEQPESRPAAKRRKWLP